MMAIRKIYNKFVNYLKKNSYISATVIVFFVLILSVASFLFIKEPEIISNIIPDRYYEVTFQYNNGQENVVQKLKKGEKAIQPENPIYEDYDFAGWYIDDELYDFNKKVVSDLVLMARYSSSDGKLIEIPEEYRNNNTNSNKDKENKDSDKTEKEETKDKETEDEDTKEEENKKEEKPKDEKPKEEPPKEDPPKEESPKEEPPKEEPPKEDLEEDTTLEEGKKYTLDEIKEGIPITYGGEKYHVIADDGKEITLLLDKNIDISPWINKNDYDKSDSDKKDSCIYGVCNDAGPLTANNVAKQKGYNGIPSIGIINNICAGGCPCWLFNNLAGPYNYCPSNQVNSGQPGYWLNGASSVMNRAKYMGSSGLIEETVVTTNLGVRPIKIVAKLKV